MPAKRKRCSRPGYKARILAYKTEGRRMKNKKKKIERHQKKHPNDFQEQKEAAVNYARKKLYTYWEKFALEQQEKGKKCH